MSADALSEAVAAVPAGRWAVGVSGGADSVALLSLLVEGRPDVSPHLVHLDHELRGEASTADAAFVADLAGRLGLPHTVVRRSDLPPASVGNPSAAYRRARLGLFRRVVERHGLAGVVLAHHADDQAETVLGRLLRGGGVTTLTGMSPATTVAGVTVVRPLLGISAVDLRTYLSLRGQPWREDASNASPAYQRNRLRTILRGRPELRDALLAVAVTAAATRDWLATNAPPLAESFGVAELAGRPGPVAEHAAGRWLVDRGSPADAVNAADRRRLIEMATVPGAPPRWTFPGGVVVRRTRGRVEAECRPARGAASDLRR